MFSHRYLLLSAFSEQQNANAPSKMTNQLDNAVTTSRPCTLLFQFAHHLFKLFHNSLNAKVNIKALLFSRNFSPWVHFLTFLTELLVILGNC